MKAQYFLFTVYSILLVSVVMIIMGIIGLGSFRIEADLTAREQILEDINSKNEKITELQGPNYELGGMLEYNAITENNMYYYTFFYENPVWVFSSGLNIFINPKLELRQTGSYTIDEWKRVTG